MQNTTSGQSHLFAYLIYFLAALFFGFTWLLQVFPSVIAQGLMRDFQVNTFCFAILAASFFLSWAFILIPSSFLYEKFSTRIMIAIGLVISVWGILFFGVTHNFVLAMIGRFCMGIGAGFAFIGLIVVSSRWFAPQYFRVLLGLALALAAMGAICGQVPMAFAVKIFVWHEAIQSVAILGAVLAILAWLVLQEYPKENAMKDYPSQRGDYRNFRAVVKNPQTWWLSFYGLLMGVAVFVFAGLWAIPYLEALYIIPNSTAAMACAMFWFGMASISILLCFYRPRRWRSFLNKCSLLGFIVSVIILYVPLSLYFMFIFLFGLGVAAIGWGFSFVLLGESKQSEVDRVVSIAICGTVAVLGAICLQLFIGFLLHLNSSASFVQNVFPHNINTYRIALSVMPVSFLLSWVISQFFIQENIT